MLGFSQSEASQVDGTVKTLLAKKHGQGSGLRNPKDTVDYNIPKYGTYPQLSTNNNDMRLIIGVVLLPSPVS